MLNSLCLAGGLHSVVAARSSEAWARLHVTPRRWRQACGIDRDLALAACGDFCGPPNAEGAVLSGRAAARAMAGALQGTGSS
jgi:predicted NAD/FAD-dependent oxidoreductase